jgi:hypothetical protein
VKLLDILGHRYARNPNASETIRRMGTNCRILAELVRFTGQQIIVVAADILRQHVATGQSPAEDAHLGTVLAWVDPVQDKDPADVAAQRALEPASPLLFHKDDKRVESLRKHAKSRKPSADFAKAEIDRILVRGVMHLWKLLTDARRAFWSLGLSINDRDSLVKESLQDLEEISFRRGVVPVNPHTLAKLHDGYEDALDATEYADVVDDPIIRDRLKRTGNVFTAEVIAVHQPIANTAPCHLKLRTKQNVLRLRREMRITSLGRNAKLKVACIVRGIESDPTDVHTTLVDVEVTTGKQRSRRPNVGDVIDWTDLNHFGGYLRAQTFKAVATRRATIIYDDSLPQHEPRPSGGTGVDLLQVARDLRKKR